MKLLLVAIPVALLMALAVATLVGQVIVGLMRGLGA